ncbi:hypothetical protein Q2T40_02320 [Winogradskyella maritima]|nr:hypothetical protein [Winogradskyella maritima]
MNSLAADDIDNDGDIDLIAGNLGLNYKYKATQDEPFHLYLNDFDGNNTNDIVLGYEQDNTLYPCEEGNAHQIKCLSSRKNSRPTKNLGRPVCKMFLVKPLTIQSIGRPPILRVHS